MSAFKVTEGRTLVHFGSPVGTQFGVVEDEKEEESK